ncbi:hypothetical protein Scep_023969 [Stephania cephalantha]|uniref:Uncharacterized protein n=1 Tax=Stephania cephalantha TaxID=152367 RepID=A0AAP0F4L7_9MAGN
MESSPLMVVLVAMVEEKYATGSEVVADLLLARPAHRWLRTHYNKKNGFLGCAVESGAKNCMKWCIYKQRVQLQFDLPRGVYCTIDLEMRSH